MPEVERVQTGSNFETRQVDLWSGCPKINDLKSLWDETSFPKPKM